MSDNICVFCGSGGDERYLEMGSKVGKILSENKLSLIYGGASIGVMGKVASEMLINGSHVVGIMPKDIIELEVSHKGLSEFIETSNMHERKTMMHQMSDLFLVLPGGMGTLDELCETITWAQLKFHKKKVCIFNFNGFYDFFIKHIEHANEEKFYADADLDLYTIVNSYDELDLFLKGR